MAMLTDSNNVKTGILIGQPKKVAANTTEAKQGNVYGAINILLFFILLRIHQYIDSNLLMLPLSSSLVTMILYVDHLVAFFQDFVYPGSLQVYNSDYR